MKILEFPHSHYCEAARWALDLKGVAYEREALLPGLHMMKVKRIAPETSVPVLINGDDVVQGSRAIIDYSDRQFVGPPLMPKDDALAGEVEGFETAADKNIGIPLRAIIYNWLLADKKSVAHCFMQNSGSFDRMMFGISYPMLKRVIRQTYIPSQKYVEKARVKFEDEISRLDDHVAGRTYLIGDRMSRADVMVASMLSIGLLPDEHSCNWPEVTDDRLNAFRNQYIDRPSFQWAAKLYREERNRHAA